ncbi:MAG: CTP synthase, partial [Alphaproteobacteria bacterium]|nr:CTP synthase [Alphaproteobacteria bacterium]
DAIKEFVVNETEGTDFILCEIGGTVGDIESLPFLEAIRQLGNDLPRGRVAYVHATLVPFIPAAGELKTKPTQHSVKELRSIGIQPDVLLCRSDREIPLNERRKIALFCNVRESGVIQGLDRSSIYEVPLAYHAEGLDEEVLKVFGITDAPTADLARWQDIHQRIVTPEGTVKIAVVGKYTDLQDAYKSLGEALVHGGIANHVDVDLEWIESEIFEQPDAVQNLEGVNGILVPGGFGERGAEGKIAAATFARAKNVPYFGICFGMQMAVIEAARNLAEMPGASSTEFGPCQDAVVGLMTEWLRGNEVESRSDADDLGGTMRLGQYECRLREGSKAHRIYADGSVVFERHRHRYEVNVNYRDRLEAAGLRFSGMSPDGELPEIVELDGHPWFVGVQFHPELKSKPFEPHPLFASFIGAAVEQSRLV